VYTYKDEAGNWQLKEIMATAENVHEDIVKQIDTWE